MNNGIFLSLGTNMGNKALNLTLALKSIRTIAEINKKSSVYSTAAWGNTDQPSFYNQVVEISTHLAAGQLLEKLLSIEIELGRVRTEHWGPRVIDIDLLFYNDSIIEGGNLTVPHPGIASRRFILEPLAEINPKFIHPVMQKSIHDLLADCVDRLGVERVIGYGLRL